MVKIKNKKTKNLKSIDNNFLVITKYPENYKVFDLRANKPVCFQDNPITGGDASMVLQEIETIDLDIKGSDKKNTLEYFAPNNVGILLSISNKSLLKAKTLFDDFIITQKFPKHNNAKESLVLQSTLIYDYIELVQTCIVFGYTALEAFINLSIPNNYEYKTEPNNKGIVEIFNKEAIERWTPLKVKISEILVEIYNTKNIKSLKVWNNFILFEELRHEIIHQKSINSTTFFKKYFKNKIFELCSNPEEIIRFFFENREDKDTTNPLWPWIINSKNEFPVSYEFNSENFEVTGNIYEGIKK